MAAYLEQEIIQQFDKWNQALLAGDPRSVAACYAEDAILLPTLSRQVRRNRSEIEDYFTEVLKSKPRAWIDEHHVRVFGDIALNSGVYSLVLQADADQKQIQARFTFVYRRTDDGWIIIDHHSSLIPE